MGFLDKLKSALGGEARSAGVGSLYPIRVRCRRCGEILTAHINLKSDLSIDYQHQVYHVRKLISGSGRNRCFQQIEVSLTFDMDRRLLDRQISGGSFVDAES